MLAMAECQSTLMLDVPTSSSDRRPEQARSHKGLHGPMCQ
ncbi:hypothetical protein SAMN05216558_1127 [Pseudomonas vancouverensis]|nr:hypothetical protein SAMN05216558_1127 [Pseudomonas vancouverensis]